MVNEYFVTAPPQTLKTRPVMKVIMSLTGLALVLAVLAAQAIS